MSEHYIFNHNIIVKAHSTQLTYCQAIKISIRTFIWCLLFPPKGINHIQQRAIVRQKGTTIEHVAIKNTRKVVPTTDPVVPINLPCLVRRSSRSKTLKVMENVEYLVRHTEKISNDKEGIVNENLPIEDFSGSISNCDCNAQKPRVFETE